MNHSCVSAARIHFFRGSKWLEFSLHLYAIGSGHDTHLKTNQLHIFPTVRTCNSFPIDLNMQFIFSGSLQHSFIEYILNRRCGKDGGDGDDREG